MDLNVAVIMRWVDRLSAPAASSARALTRFSAAKNGIVRGSGAVARAAQAEARATAVVTKAQQAGAAASTTLAAATETVAKATAAAAAPVQALGQATTAAAETSAQLVSVQGQAAASTERVGQAAEVATRRFSIFERSQFRARAASRALGTEVSKLESQIGKLAIGSLAVDGLQRAGRSIVDPIKRSIESAAEFNKGMTGIGIVGDLTDAQLAPVAANIYRTAQRLGISVRSMQEDDMAVLNEGVYRRPGEVIQASQAAAKLSLLSDYAGVPITGAEAGALVAAYAHGMNAPAGDLDRLNAELFRSSQLGGDRIGDVARFMPKIMGQLKGRAFGNEQGYLDALTGLQITKRVAGDDETAGIDYTDLLQNLNHRLTAKRFAKAGIDLEGIIAKAHTVGVSPVNAALNAIMGKIGTNPNDPGLAGKLGHFFMNAQAAQAALAIITNQRDTANAPGYNTLRKQIAAGADKVSWNENIARAMDSQTAALMRLANAQTQLANATGEILAPALGKVADFATRAADGLSRMEKHSGWMGKLAIYGAGAVGLSALALGGVGHLAVGVLGPLLIARSLFGRIAPLSGELLRQRAIGRMSRVAGGAGRLALVPGRFGLAVLRGAAAAPGLAIRGAMAAPAALMAGVQGTITAIATTAAGAASATLRLGGAIMAAGRAAIGFATGGRIASTAMTLLKFSVRGVLAASGIGLLVLAAGFLIEHWRGVLTFFEGFGRGFSKALGPLRPAIQPAVDMVGRLAGWVGKLLGGKPGEDWSKWGEAAGAAVGKVVKAIADLIAKVIGAVGQIGNLWAVIAGHGAAVTAAGVAAAAPPPHVLPPHPAAAAAPAGHSTHIGKIEQHFHLPGVDPKATLAEAQRQGARGARRALHDEADG